MSRNKVVLLLSVCILISIFLHFYKINQVPPCINADEAAFAYNAYSILKTGKDEYGKFMPLRFESFRDYKLPIYTYFSIPFVAIFGLNDFSTRALNIIIGIAFVPLMYFLARELFKNEKIALVSAFLTSLSPGIYILSRHAHEGVIGTFFILLTLLFLVKYLKVPKLQYFIFANFFLLLNAFSYQTGRVYLLFFFVLELFILFFVKKPKSEKKLLKICLLIAVVSFSLFFDFKYGLNRVNNLFFFKNPGFQLRLTEYLGEHPLRLFHNKGTEVLRDITNRYLTHLSPQFLSITGDTSWRFGFQNLGLFTPIEYFFFFIGIYYLFKFREKHRYLLLFLLFITPLNSALTWQDASLIRSYTMLFLIITITSFGVYHLSASYKKNRFFLIAALTIIVLFSFYKLNNLDIYFYHYPKRAVIVRAWQCGYKELIQYIKSNYNKFDKFYITDHHGQPYIFLLYFWTFNPAAYQMQAKISAPDQYGFGHVGKFDKFEFRFNFDKNARKTVFVGYPEEFNQIGIDTNKIKKIKIGTEEIFWIYENN